MLTEDVLASLSLPLQGSFDSKLPPLTGKTAEETNQRTAQIFSSKMTLGYPK